MNADGDPTDRPRMVRALSGGVGLLAQPRSQDQDSLLFSPMDAPLPASSSPPLADPDARTHNLRLDIPPQEPVGDARPFEENEGICTEVGSLGQEIQLESGDHLNALERIYLYTQSKATFHRIFMSRALPTYLDKVTPLEAVEYVLPLLGGLAIDEEERVKETFVAELLDIIWWFFTTCQVTDQEPAEEPSDPPLVSVQSFSAVLASLLLSSNPEVSATARGTVVELLGRARWIAKGQGLDQVQTTRYCETMRPVEPWSRGLLGPDEARMIQLEIIYGVVIDLGRLDLNGEYVEGEGAVDEHGAEGVETAATEGVDDADELYNLPVANTSQEDLPTLVQNLLTDPAKTPTAETVKSYIDESDTSSKTTGSVSHSASSSLTSFEPGSAPASATTFPSSAITFPSATFPSSIAFQSQATSTATDSSSSLNLPELSPGDSSSRSSVASPTEPVSPPEGAGADYVTTVVPDSYAGSESLQYTGSVPSSDGETDELMWHTPRGGEGFETGYFDPPVASPGSGSTVVASPLAGQLSGSTPPNQLSSGQLSVPGSSSQLSVPSGSSQSSPLQTRSSPLAYGQTATPTGLAPPRLARQDSMLSVGTDDYVDAESGEGWEDEGYLADAGEEPGTQVPAGETDAHPSEEGHEYPAETGDAFAGVDDAYIDDGAAAEEAAIGRVASMSLIAAVTSSGVVDEEYYTLFVEEVLRVSANPVYWVRSETSYALGTLAKTVHEDMVESDLLPILETLIGDAEAHVRQASVFAIPPVLTRLSPQRRRELASRYVLKLCEDTADSVRTGALQVLAEVIHAFHQDQDGPPEELVDFFLKGEKEQIHAPLPKSQADQKTPSAEKDQFTEWGGQSLATWGAEPSSYFEAEPSFPDADRALICAFNYPAIALTLGPKRWDRLSEYYRYLAEESWHTPKVRATLAASAGEIARVIGPRAALADVVPVWWICVTSDQREAKIKALNALPMLLEALDVEGRTEVAGKMSEVWENHVAGWKEREAFVRQLGAVAPLLKDHGLVLCRIFKSGVEDRVAAIREVAIEALPVLHEVLKDNNAHIQVARNDLFALGASGMCRHKTIFLACCRVLVQSPVGASILDDSRFGPSIVPLAEHSVIDVRIALGRLLTVICEHHMHTRNQRPHWVADCLEKLGLDASADVRAFVHRAHTAEYIEPRPVDTKPKPEVRPTSPPYAEFSRPP